LLHGIVTNLASRIVTVLFKVSTCCDHRRNGTAPEIIVTAPITSVVADNNA
jgi:hypothetical protein